MRFLAVETSQKTCSLALFDNGKLVAERTSDRVSKQVEELFPMWQQLMETAGITLNELDAYVTTLGPGTFAGTRVAIAACKSVALHSQASVYGINTLEAIALQHAEKDDLLVCIDASRDQWYTQIFEHGRAVANPALMGVDEVLTHSARHIACFDPSGKLATTPQTTHYHAIDATLIGQAFIAQQQHNSDVTPCYVRPPDAKKPKPSTL